MSNAANSPALDPGKSARSKSLGVVASGTVQGLIGGACVAVALAITWGAMYALNGSSYSDIAMAVPYFFIYFGIVGVFAGSLAGLAVGAVLKGCRSRRSKLGLRIIASAVCIGVCFVVSLPFWIYFWNVMPFALLAAAVLAAWRAPNIADPSRR